MLRLYLLRHAKSAWDQPDLADHDRALAPRGIAACRELAAVIADRGWHPDRILCSTATRTRQTLAGVDLLGDAVTIFSNELYDLRDADYVEFIRHQGAETRSLMLIGHNSATERTASLLTGETLSFPTAAMAVIDFESQDWRQIGCGEGILTAFWRPT